MWHEIYAKHLVTPQLRYRSTSLQTKTKISISKTQQHWAFKTCHGHKSNHKSRGKAKPKQTLMLRTNSIKWIFFVVLNRTMRLPNATLQNWIFGLLVWPCCLHTTVTTHLHEPQKIFLHQSMDLLQKEWLPERRNAGVFMFINFGGFANHQQKFF